MRVAAFALLLLVAPALGSSGPPPPDRKVYVPREAWCPDAAPVAGTWTQSTPPILTAYSGRTRFGLVTPGTCAWIDGHTARSAIRLWCAHTTPQLGARAIDAESIAARAGCVVPAGQDFRP